MESGKMTVVFSSIGNGSHQKWPGNKAKSDRREPAANLEKRFMPDIKYFDTIHTPVDFREKSSSVAFTSLINASSCANIQNDKALNGYVTVTPDGAYLRKHL